MCLYFTMFPKHRCFCVDCDQSVFWVCFMCLINILIAIVLLIGGIFCDTDIVTDWSISAVQNYHLVYSMIRYDKTVLI